MDDKTYGLKRAKAMETDNQTDKGARSADPVGKKVKLSRATKSNKTRGRKGINRSLQGF